MNTLVKIKDFNFNFNNKHILDILTDNSAKLITFSRLNKYDKVNLSQLLESIYSSCLNPAQQLRIYSSFDPYLNNPIPLNQMLGFNDYNLVDSYFQQNLFTSNSKGQTLVLRNFTESVPLTVKPKLSLFCACSTNQLMHVLYNTKILNADTSIIMMQFIDLVFIASHL